VLAAGLVFGVGAGSTLAAWTDQTYARGEFTTSTFQVEANAGAGWVPASDSAGAAVLTFNTSTGLMPGASRYAPLSLRTTTGSLGGTVALKGATVDTSSGTLGAALQYRVVASATCNAAAFTAGATYLVGGATGTGAFQPLTVGQTGTTALGGATATAQGAPLQLCFQITLPTGAPNALQGKTTTASWTLDSTSVTQ
jgi:predicted ribosomally synthesized peptide with SipW-like signal peptide